MKQYTDTIKATAKRLLEDGTVDCFIGFRKGTMPMINHPVVITDAAKADTLYWDGNCGNNLALYLTGRKADEKIGIVATGCVSRNINLLIAEGQVTREQLYIVGAPCKGMIERRSVEAAVGHREILSVNEEGEKLIVEGKGFKEELNRADHLQRNCVTCRHHNPVEHNDILGSEVSEPAEAPVFTDLEEAAAKSDEDRWNFFQQTFESCIRCYACRNACPMCYCPTCFVDEAKPQWVGKSSDKVDTMTFHFLRAFHLAGRCTDCGACERVCPVDIPVRYLTNKLNRDAQEFYDYSAGLVAGERPLLDQYKLTDIEDFIK